VSADRYLGAARTASLLLLVTVYLAVDIARSNVPRLLLLADARGAFTSAFFEQLVDDDKVLVVRNGQSEWWGIPEVESRSHVLKPQFGAHQDVPGIGRLFVMREQGAKYLFAHRRDGRRWIATRLDSAGAAIGGEARLRDIALELSLEPKDDYHATFRAIENELIDRRVEISGAGIALRSDLAPWLIALFNLGLLILIRNHVRRALDITDGEEEEPWLLLDGHVGLERVAALGWLAALVTAPWISSATLLMTLAARVHVDGSISTWATDGALMASALTLVIAGGWVALTLTADVVSLRAERRSHLTSAPAAPAEEEPA
jgi:hypothetical protein